MATRKRPSGRASGELSEKEILLDISHKLDVLTGIIAIQGKGLGDQIRTLTGLGLSSSEIGLLVAKHPDYVRSVRSRR